MSLLLIMYLRPRREIRRHGRDIPHWQQDEVMQFVRFRLGDAMPEGKLEEWKEDRNRWEQRNPKPWTEELRLDYHRRFTARIEKWLDQGHGSCLLRNGGCREVLKDVMMKFDGVKVRQHSWVIMPNHVHVLFTPMTPMEKLLKAWKGVSANQIGKGSIWQKEYWDTMIRDFDHYVNVIRYIRKNPVGLKESDYTLYEGEAVKEIE